MVMSYSLHSKISNKIHKNFIAEFCKLRALFGFTSLRCFTRSHHRRLNTAQTAPSLQTLPPKISLICESLAQLAFKGEFCSIW